MVGLDWDRHQDWDRGQGWNWDLGKGWDQGWNHGPAGVRSSPSRPPHSPAMAFAPPPHSAPSQSQTSAQPEMTRSRKVWAEGSEPGQQRETDVWRKSQER